MLDNNSNFTHLIEKYNLKRFNCCVYYNDKICVVDVSYRYVDLIIFESIPNFDTNNTSNYGPSQPYCPLDWIADVSSFTLLDKKLNKILNGEIK